VKVYRFSRVVIVTTLLVLGVQLFAVPPGQVPKSSGLESGETLGVSKGLVKTVGLVSEEIERSGTLAFQELQSIRGDIERLNGDIELLGKEIQEQRHKIGLLNTAIEDAKRKKNQRLVQELQVELRKFYAGMERLRRRQEFLWSQRGRLIDSQLEAAGRWGRAQDEWLDLRQKAALEREITERQRRLGSIEELHKKLTETEAMLADLQANYDELLERVEDAEATAGYHRRQHRECKEALRAFQELPRGV